LLFGHPVVHRMLKDMVKGEAAWLTHGDGKAAKPEFASTMAKILLKHFEAAIGGRGVFILLELIENPATQALVSKQLKAQIKVIQEAAKKDSSAKGLQVLLKKVKQA